MSFALLDCPRRFITRLTLAPKLTTRCRRRIPIPVCPQTTLVVDLKLDSAGTNVINYDKTHELTAGGVYNQNLFTPYRRDVSFANIVIPTPFAFVITVSFSAFAEVRPRDVALIAFVVVVRVWLCVPTSTTYPHTPC